MVKTPAAAPRAGTKRGPAAGPGAWRVLVLALVAASCSLTAARAGEASPYGIDVHAPQGADLAFVLDKVQAAGIGWVRIDLVWAWVEPAPGVFDWSLYDALTAAAAARGISIYATLASTPAWATHGPAATGVPDDPATWSDFCFRAAQRYRNAIRYWGLWNEPNLPRFWSGSRGQYIDLILKPGADAVHSGNPLAKVGGPELAHLDSAQWYYWLRDTIRQAGDHLDFVTHHIYDASGNRGVVDKLTASTPFGGQPGLWGLDSPSVEEVLKNAGWWGKPFWLTETGWESAKVSEPAQATWYAGLLDDWFTGRDGQRWISQVFFYELEDPPVQQGPTFGVLRADGTPKAAYFAYRDFIAAHQPRLDAGQLIGGTIPDSMETGQTVTVRLTFQNVGTTTWTAAAGYKLGAVGDKDAFAVPRQLLAPGEAIAPGQRKTFVFDMTAPELPAVYQTQWQMLQEGVAWFGDVLGKAVSVAQAPPPEQRTLSFDAGRFSVSVSWRDQHSGKAGFGRALRGSEQSGYFWFFDPSNVELVVKVLDGRPVNGSFWVFYGALSDVEYWVTATDNSRGQTRRYHNPPGNLCGQADVAAFPSSAPSSATTAAGPSGEMAGESLAMDAALPPAGLPAPAGAASPGQGIQGISGEDPAERVGSGRSLSGPCSPGAQNLCLLGSRFKVEVRWRTPDGSTGSGQAVASTDQTGTFWFFSAQNVELVVKVLDGTALTGKYWVFYGALSDVEYWITVTDSRTGASKVYHNRSGNLCGLGDTSAL